MQIVIVIPTYNERSNISKLIPEIRRSFTIDNTDVGSSTTTQDDSRSMRSSMGATDHDVHIVVVDDSSSDGTSDAVLAMSSKDSRIHLIKRPGKLGLGSAYRDAFEWIMKNLNAQVIIQMDADLSHPPNLLPKMIRTLEEKSAEVVVASRYLDTGGSTNWPLYRKLISKGANTFARVMLGIKVNDITSGYRAYSVSCVSDLLHNKFSSSGYEYQIEVLYILSRLNKKIVEIPFIFANRAEGKSKLGMKDIMKFASTVLKLRGRPIDRTNIHLMAT